MEEILREGLGALGLGADAEAIARLRRYAALLEEKNRVMNLTAIDNEDRVDGNTENGCEDNKVVDGWQAVTVLPLVDRLWVSETENCLEVSYSETCGLSQSQDVLTCCSEVDNRYIDHGESSESHCWYLLFRRSRGRKSRSGPARLIIYVCNMFFTVPRHVCAVFFQARKTGLTVKYPDH